VKENRNAGFPGAWRVFFGAAMGICRTLTILLAVILVLPLALSKVILALVAAGWLPPKATVAAYLLPVFFFGLGIILCLVLILRNETQWSQALFRVLVGDAEERIQQALGNFSRPAPLPGEPDGEPGGEFTAQSNISQQEKDRLSKDGPDIEQTGGPPEKA